VTSAAVAVAAAAAALGNRLPVYVSCVFVCKYEYAKLHAVLGEWLKLLHKGGI